VKSYKEDLRFEFSPISSDKPLGNSNGEFVNQNLYDCDTYLSELDFSTFRF